MTDRCAKCGATDIYTRYHKPCYHGGCSTCHHGTYSNPCPGGSVEHLSFTCRGCGYVWTSKCRDADGGSDAS